MELDHTIVSVKDKEVSAGFFSRILGFEYKGVSGTQSKVRVSDSLVMRFDERERESEHYAFHVSDQEFDDAIARLTSEGIAYGARPRQDDRQWANRDGGRRVFFKDPDGNDIELLTASPRD